MNGCAYFLVPFSAVVSLLIIGIDRGNDDAIINSIVLYVDVASTGVVQLTTRVPSLFRSRGRLLLLLTALTFDGENIRSI